MVRSTFPDVETQTEFYAKVLDHAGERPVHFRTLDVGGDKKLTYFDAQDQENPALGWRDLRIGLERPAMLRAQVRALVRACGGRPIRVMCPMVTCVSELRGTRRVQSGKKSRRERVCQMV